MDKITNLKHALLKNKKSLVIVSCKGFSFVDDFLDDIASKLNNGADFILYNPEGLNDLEAVEVGFKISQLASIFQALFIVQSRADIAKILDAQGIYLLKNDISAKQAKLILSEEKLIGAEVFFENVDFTIKNNEIIVNLQSEERLNG